MTLTPYQKYKDSEYRWLGKIPENWEIKKLRHVLKPTTTKNQPDLPLLSVVREKGVILRDVSSKEENHNVIPEDLSNYKVVKTGQFAMNKMKAWQGSYGISKYDGIVSPAYFIFDLKYVTPGFFHQAIRSKKYVSFFGHASDGVRIGQWDLSLVRMKEIPFVIPPQDEQLLIKKYLTFIHNNIQKYISAKRKLIKLLEEQKQAIIHQAVIGAIDVKTGKPYASYATSNIPWISRLPKSWNSRRLRTVSTMLVSNVDKHVIENEKEVRLCNYVDVYKNERITESLDFMKASATPDEIQNFKIYKNDVLVTKDSEIWTDIGVPSLVCYEAADLLCGYHLAIIRPYKLLSGEYLLRLLQDRHIATQMHVSANGVTRYGLSHGDIKNVIVPVPPIIEQSAIADYLDRFTKNTERTVNQYSKEIELIQEYRTSVIADVVTGKVDVRKVASVLPDEIEMVEDLNSSEEENIEDESEMDENELN